MFHKWIVSKTRGRVRSWGAFFLACLFVHYGHCDGNVAIFWSQLYKFLSKVPLLKHEVALRESRRKDRMNKPYLMFGEFFHYRRTWNLENALYKMQIIKKIVNLA